MQLTHRRWARMLAGALALMMTLCVCLYAQSEVPEGARFAELVKNKKTTFSKKGTTIDYGNADQGYIMVKQEPVKTRIKVKVTKGDNSLAYDLNNDGYYEVFPLQMGSGSYKVEVLKQVKGTTYSKISSTTIKAKLVDENICYLYPNQYAWYDETYNCVAKSAEICEGLTSDKDKIDAIYEWCATKISYDYILAMTVKSGYIPDVDEVIEKQIAICFGYAAVMCCMLRTQGIETQLVIGYADKTYHAWNHVMVDGEWQRKDATFAATNAKCKNYTPERRY